jgi:antitoxin component YwqK of YwqJK toxin-antitoxin module
VTIQAYFSSCAGGNNCVRETVLFKDSFIDSIKQHSDTNYTKPYRNSEFVTADYYVNKKDSMVCQVMKDSASHVRQVIVSRKSIRVFTAEYFASGQLKTAYQLDSLGKFHGVSKSYFEDGCIRKKGMYHHGLYKGTWEIFNEKGEIESTEEYDSNGQLVGKTNL